MDIIIELANKLFKPILEMGGPIIMLIILTVLALLFGVKFSKALEGGIKLAIALTGIGAIIGMLNGAFSASLAKFVENTGIQLNITDVGWAPLATITWGSAWTLYFLLIMLIVNVKCISFLHSKHHYVDNQHDEQEVKCPSRSPSDCSKWCPTNVGDVQLNTSILNEFCKRS